MQCLKQIDQNILLFLAIMSQVMQQKRYNSYEKISLRIGILCLNSANLVLFQLKVYFILLLLSINILYLILSIIENPRIVIVACFFICLFLLLLLLFLLFFNGSTHTLSSFGIDILFSQFNQNFISILLKDPTLKKLSLSFYYFFWNAQLFESSPNFQNYTSCLGKENLHKN